MIDKKVFKKPIILNNRSIRKKNINIQKYFDESNDLLFNSIEKLFKTKKRITDNISCPSCGHKEKKNIYKISKFFYDMCLNCKSVYVSNPLKKIFLLINIKILW